MNTDREDIADRVISNERLIQIFHEKDKTIYRLEIELSEAREKLNKLADIIGSIQIK